MPTLTEILFFSCLFPWVTTARSWEDLQPPLPSIMSSSHLGDGFQRSDLLSQDRLVQPCKHPHAPCWGPDPEGAEHPWDQACADRGLPGAAVSGGPGLTPVRCLQGCALPWVQREARIFFWCFLARLAAGAVSASVPYRGCLSAVFVLICSLRLLAAKLKLVEWENRGPLSPGLFSLSAHAAAIAHRAGETRWQDRSSTLVPPDWGTWCFRLLQQFPCPNRPPELPARGFCSRRDAG